MKNSKGLKRKALIRNKKAFYCEDRVLDGGSVYFLFENEESTATLNTIFEFKLTGY